MVNYKSKIDDFYTSFIQRNAKCFSKQYERCIVEEYRNCLSKLFKIPSGHRWQFEEWYIIQDYAFQLLVNAGFITEGSKKFYCKKLNNI